MYRVFVNILPFYLQRSTDKDYAKSLLKNSKALNATFFYPKNIMWGFRENILLIVNKILSLLGIKYSFKIIYPKPYLNSEFNEHDYDIVYSQEICPQNTGKVPVLIESTLWMPGQNSPSSVIAEKYYQEEKLPRFFDYLKHKAIINLKSRKEIENANNLFPEFKDRFVYLPFLLPDLIPITEKELINKHQDDAIIRIGFLGGQAIRKGLPDLIEAYKKVKEQIDRKIELHIISGYTDGEVYIPEGLDIIEYGKLPYERAQEVMKTWHIFIMVSNNESYGLVYIEAMANGCINVVRDFYPQKEFVDYGKIGYLATPGNVESIAVALKNVILLSREERTFMALAGLRKYYSEFEYSVVASKFRDVFEKCVDIG